MRRTSMLILVTMAVAVLVPAIVQAEEYAFLVSSSAATGDNRLLDSEFWYDLSAQYSLLIDEGYTDENIFVHYGNPTNMDTSLPQYQYPGNIVDALSERDIILGGLDDLATIIQSDDKLVVWWMGHGRIHDYPDGSHDVDLYELDEIGIRGKEILSRLINLATTDITLTISTCHSGGIFESNTLIPSDFVVMAACEWDEVSYSDIVCDSFHHQFASATSNALHQQYPGRLCGKVPSDTDADYQVSYGEAFDFASVNGSSDSNTPVAQGPLASRFVASPAPRAGAFRALESGVVFNGIIEPGETVNMFTSVFNPTGQALSNVLCTLEILTGAEEIEVLDSTATVVYVGADALNETQDTIVFNVASGCPIGHLVEFRIQVDHYSMAVPTYGYFKLLIGSQSPDAILVDDIHYRRDDGWLNEIMSTLNDGDWVAGASGAGKSFFLGTTLETVGVEGALAFGENLQLWSFDVETGDQIDFFSCVDSVFYGNDDWGEYTNQYIGLAADDRSGPVQNWYISRQEREKTLSTYELFLMTPSAAGPTSIADLPGRATGLAFDRDNFHLWCMIDGGLDDPDLLCEYDVTQPTNPTLIQGPFVVPWPSGMISGAAGLDYDEDLDALIAVNHELQAVVLFQDTDPSYDGVGTVPGVTLGSELMINSYAPFGVAASHENMLIGNQVGASLVSPALKGLGPRPRRIDRFIGSHDNSIIENSVSCSSLYDQDINNYWEFTWRTDEWTNPELDAVIVDNDPSSRTGNCLPYALTFRSGTGGVETTVTVSTVDGWDHRMTVPRDCQAPCSMLVTVKSIAFGDELIDADNPFRVKRCLSNQPRMVSTFAEPTPNPFNPRTKLMFNVPANAKSMELVIFSLAGEKVRTLAQGPAVPGSQSVTWYGKDDSGRRLSSGAYFARLKVDDTIQIKKLIMIK